jgi:uncharacterized protein DUF4062
MLSAVDGNRPRPRRVFIAHTSELSELPEKRSFVQAARDAIVAAGDLPVEMASFTASERPPAELCREQVRGADVLVLIAGFRYGSPVIDEPELSYTELEFEKAQDEGVRPLIFLLDEKATG